MRKIKFVFLFLLFCPFLLHSQVTIGSTEVPLAGALLQLTEGTLTSKGLGMPRVKLTNQKDIKVDIPSVQAGQEITHTGLIVYNTNKCLNYSGNDDGLYVWTGSEWNQLKNTSQSSDVQVYEDKRDPNNIVNYPYRTFGDAGVWMLKDIRATKYDTGIDGSMTLNGGISSINHYYAYPGKDGTSPTDATDFLKNENLGLLYNTAAVLNLGSGIGQITLPTTNEWNTAHAQRQGVCPNGWHVPSTMEWAALQKYIYNNASNYSTSNTASFSPVIWNDRHRRLERTNIFQSATFAAWINETNL